MNKLLDVFGKVLSTKLIALVSGNCAVITALILCVLCYILGFNAVYFRSVGLDDAILGIVSSLVAVGVLGYQSSNIEIKVTGAESKIMEKLDKIDVKLQSSEESKLKLIDDLNNYISEVMDRVLESIKDKNFEVSETELNYILNTAKYDISKKLVTLHKDHPEIEAYYMGKSLSSIKNIENLFEECYNSLNLVLHNKTIPADEKNKLTKNILDDLVSILR